MNFLCLCIDILPILLLQFDKSAGYPPEKDQKPGAHQPKSHEYSADRSVSYEGLKHKHPGFSSGEGHIETLSWAVNLKSTSFFSDLNGLDLIASEIAHDLDLVSKGQIGHFDDVYLFVHEDAESRTSHTKTGNHGNNVHVYNQNNFHTSTFHNSFKKASKIEETPSSFSSESHTEAGKSSIPLNQESVNTLRSVLHNDTSGADSEDLVSLTWRTLRDKIHSQIDQHHGVQWYSQQIVRKRTKRTVQFQDPMYQRQWHLNNYLEPTMDINVTGVWDRNITGRGVIAVVVDDGLEWTVPDIYANYKKEGSWDLNSNDADPLPNTEDASNHHGTRCAGEIAAATNHKCGVGVAYEAGIAGIRVLDGPMTDSLEATAFTKNYDINDVYSCSWGPDDDGKTVDGPHHLANLALRHGVAFGRQGYGSIYVVASGNGGASGDNCNYDGYANSIFTMTIGAVDEGGAMPYYAEECASMLAVTFSSGSPGMRYIVTTDWQHKGGTGCTEQHSGTSAAAPLAAGMVVLALQARPCLTWRDVQHIMVVTALKIDVDIAHWQKNAAGLHHSHKHGFGLMNAWRIVNAAKIWEPVPWMTVFTSPLMTVHDNIIGTQSKTYQYNAYAEQLNGYNLYSLEYVQVTVTIAHSHRGNLQINLVCPSGTKSVLGASRPKDDSIEGFKAWTFSTVRCWAEKPEGTYQLTVHDTGRSLELQGQFISWQLKLFGSPMTFDEVQERIRKVKDSYSGAYLNDSYVGPCAPPPDKVSLVAPLSDRILKILVLTGCFAMFMAVYESVEYIFCYNDEKKEQSKLLTLMKRAQRLVRNRLPSGGSSSNRAAEEQQNLLRSVSQSDTPEMIPLSELGGSTGPHAGYSGSVQPDFGGKTSRSSPGNGAANRGHNRGKYFQIPDNDTQSLQGAVAQLPISTDQSDRSRKSSLHPNGRSKNSSLQSSLGAGRASDVIPAPLGFHHEESSVLNFDEFVSADEGLLLPR